MRIRLYDARVSDALPGNVLFEEDLPNPSRTPTGVIAYVQGFAAGMLVDAAEYRFEAGLPAPMSLDAGTAYWLEIVQLGDMNTIFGWIGADIERTGSAILDATPNRDWVRFGGFDMAFQLSTVPEPGTLAFLAVGLGICGRSNRSAVRRGDEMNDQELTS